jgi:hypothetical protein
MDLRSLVFIVLGAGCGFAYAHFIGCKSGVCVIWSNRGIATLYGAMMGLFLARG